jgi:hypothetical protein
MKICFIKSIGSKVKLLLRGHEKRVLDVGSKGLIIAQIPCDMVHQSLAQHGKRN